MSALQLFIPSILPIIIGHRCIKEFAPENTISGAFIAKNKGIKFIEIDAMITKDLYPIIHHDYDTKRCSNTDLIISDTNIDELKKYDFGKYYSNNFENERIPLLKDMIRICHIIDLGLNIEIKCLEEDLITPIEICKEIRKYNGDPNKIVISSFSKNALIIAKYYLPEFERNLIVDKIPNTWYNICNDLDCKCLIFNYKTNTIKEIKNLLKYNKQIYAYTVNNIDIVNKLIDIGVSGIFTDKPYTILTKIKNKI